MNYAAIIYDDIANGPGIRTSLFVSGCRRSCEGCFNKEAQSFEYGKPYNDKVEMDIINSMDEYHHGLSILGGEPLEPENAPTLLSLVKLFRSFYPKEEGYDKNIWLFSGWKFEDILKFSDSNPIKQLVLSVDVLVDGPFILKERDITLKFRGSRNQRLIDIKKYNESGIIQCVDDSLF